MRKLYFLIFAIAFSFFVNAQCPTVTVSPAPSATMACTGINSFTGTFTNPTGGSTVQWWGPGNSLVQSTVTGSSFPAVLTTGNPGTYTFMVTNNTSNCVASQTVLLSPNNPTVIPSMTINSASGYSVNCITPSLAMSIAGSSSIAPINYTWTNVTTSVSVYPVTGTYTITSPGLYVANYQDGYGCKLTQTIQVLGTTCVGVNELSLNTHISISPNPNNGKFSVNIDAYFENAELRIINAIGQEVLKQSVKQGRTEINAAGIAKGIYYYSIIQNKEPVNKGKIVID